MSLPIASSAPAAPYGSVPVQTHPLFGAARTAPYAQVGPQLTAAHQIGGAAEIDLTRDTDGDQTMIGDIGTTNQPVAIPGSIDPPNMDAFFDRDSTIVVREIMHNDRTPLLLHTLVLNPKYKRLLPHAS